MAGKIRRDRRAIEQAFLRESRAAVEIRGPVIAADAGRDLVGEVFGERGTREGKRQLEQLLVVQAGADFGRVGLQLWQRTGDRNDLDDGTDFERNVDTK